MFAAHREESLKSSADESMTLQKSRSKWHIRNADRHRQSSLCNYCLIEKRLTTLNCLQPNSASTAMLNGRIFIDSLCFRAERHHSVTSTHNAEMNEINETRFSEYHEYMMVNIKGTLRGGRAQLFTLVAKYLVEHFYVCFLLVVVISYITLPAIITYSVFPPTDSDARTHSLTLATERKIPEDV